MRVTLYNLASATLALLQVTGVTDAHGVVDKPPARVVGSAMNAACGPNAYKTAKSDKYGPIENAVNKVVAGDGYNPREDNLNAVSTFKVGQVVPMHADIEAHHPGSANVSILSTSSKKMIGNMLKYWPVYATYPYGPDDHDWNVTIPDLGTSCNTVGACVLQWWWYSPGNKQTYESCVDFVISP
ncbi:hypothetical protein BOTBODRAFT_45204 [Botryobasidium botryosum FD-172 SS1]|uniref:Chitin-binding type-4 domain-containing protein n=1 Tax=Botryobasidium botryosum (strain FD-172 SS1) TaxID=930990 RepID=A0A067MFP1_BOTB1|nr:hypothetical protein BOTBODRAFT_45204 [Botryobasidium botryosum FD-172 SS1]